MNILALNPPFLPKFSRESRSPAVAKSGTLYYPMWLAYAVGSLEKSGHTCQLIDAAANNLSYEQIAAAAKKFGPGLAVLDTSTPSIYSDVDIAVRLKKDVPGLFVVLVGVHVSAVPSPTLELNTEIDAVAVGEYDATLVELAEVLRAGRTDNALLNVAGLAFRDSTGKVVINQPRPFLEDLDSLPMVSEVYRRHLDISPYFYSHSRHPIVVLVTGRGCPFHCTYCVVPQTLQGHRYRKRSIESVVAEFVYIAQNFPDVKEIMIEDDTLTADKGRCRDFANALIAAKATTIPWSANSRADVDYETLALLRKAGCRLFCVGFESGDQQILDNIQKSITLEKIHAFVASAHRAGILIHGCFMLGNRGETPQTLEATLQLAKKLNPDTAQFFPIMVYPGTSDFEYYGKKGWIATTDYRKWLTTEGLHTSVVSNPELPYEALVAFCDRARTEYYLRPRYIAAKLFQVVRHPYEARRLFMAFRTFIRYLFSPSIHKS